MTLFLFPHIMLYIPVNSFSTKMLRIKQGISRSEDAKPNATQLRADCNFFFHFNAVSFFFLCCLAFSGLAGTPRLDFDVND